MFVYILVYLSIIYWNGLNYNFLKVKGKIYDFVYDCINDER